MKSTDMIRMANQIATYFKSYPHEEAVAETAGHIKSFWDPRMRDALYDHVGNGGSGLDDLVREAVTVLKPAAFGDRIVEEPARGS